MTGAAALRGDLEGLAPRVADAQRQLHELLADRARLAYRANLAGLSHADVARALGVSRQMAARLVTRGYELCAADAAPARIAVPPTG